MNALKYISVIWAIIFTLVCFGGLFESRYSNKKTLTLTGIFMGPLAVVNFVLFIILGPSRYLLVLIPFCAIPSCIFFWVLAKYRDGRFFFTFCMVDTMMLEVLYITFLLDYFSPGDSNVLLFASRMIIYPLIAYYVYKRVRPMYLAVQKNTEKGWFYFTLIGVVFYIAMTFSMAYPILITERMECMPVLVLMFVLMPYVYMNILKMLRQQQVMYEMKETENILGLQVANLKVRMEEIAAADEKFRMERHNFRHKMQTIAALIDKKEYDKLRNLVDEYNEGIEETKVIRYCNNAVIDAVFASYIHNAESKGICVTTKIVLPDSLQVSEAEFATVIANAIENAINACRQLEDEDRYIDIQVISEPNFMLQISNSFNGEIELDENGIPVNSESDHGFGMRSIVAFCEKNNAFYEFKIDKNRFAIRIVIP